MSAHLFICFRPKRTQRERSHCDSPDVSDGEGLADDGQDDGGQDDVGQDDGGQDDEGQPGVGQSYAVQSMEGQYTADMPILRHFTAPNDLQNQIACDNNQQVRDTL